MSDTRPDPMMLLRSMGLGLADGVDTSDARRVEDIAWLERLKSACCAVQSVETHALDRSVRATATSQQEDAALQRSVNAQVALARRESPRMGSQRVGTARALVEEMPHTLAALESGRTSEWRATLMVRETAVLSREDRVAVDAQVGPRIGSMGNRQVEAAAKKAAYQLDPGSVLRRVKGAESDRHVSLRPAPDTMTYLTAFLPVAQGVAVHTVLRRQAESLRGQGDQRSLGALMADTLVGRVTGREEAKGIPVEIRLVTTPETLLDQGDEPGTIPGYGPIPAFLVRRLTRDADQAWIRRLFTQPGTGELIGMESTRRFFDGLLRELVITRDQTCRTPWCDAPIRHIDHVTPAETGGPTSYDNAQGLCARCNHTKQAPGWHARPGPREGVTTYTPTGTWHSSMPPPLPGTDSAMTPPPPPPPVHERVTGGAHFSTGGGDPGPEAAWPDFDVA